MSDFSTALTAWSFRTRDGITLCGWETPRRGRPLILFRHGNGFSSRSYQPMLEQLYHYFDLILLDAQGHGESEAGEQFLGWNANADHALEYIDAHREQWGDVPLLGLGHSFGGVLTLLSASPERNPFEQIVLLDPVIFPPLLLTVMQLLQSIGLGRSNATATRALNRKSHWSDREAARQNLMGRGIFRNWSEAAFNAYLHDAIGEDVELGGVSLKCPPNIEAAIFSTLPRGLWKSIRHLDIPATIVVAEESYPFVAKSARKASRMNPLVTMEFSAGGHCYMQEQPERAAEQIIQQFQPILDRHRGQQ